MNNYWTPDKSMTSLSICSLELVALVDNLDKSLNSIVTICVNIMRVHNST